MFLFIFEALAEVFLGVLIETCMEIDSNYRKHPRTLMAFLAWWVMVILIIMSLILLVWLINDLVL